MIPIHLIGFLAKCFPSSLENERGDWTLYIDSPAGQLSWKIEDQSQVDYLRGYIPVNMGRYSDQHTEAENNRRLTALTLAIKPTTAFKFDYPQMKRFLLRGDN